MQCLYPVENTNIFENTVIFVMPTVTAANKFEDDIFGQGMLMLLIKQACTRIIIELQEL